MKLLNAALIRSLSKKALVLTLGAFLLPFLSACQTDDVGVGEDVTVGGEEDVAQEPVTTDDTTGVAGDEAFTVAERVEENVELDEITGNLDEYVGRVVSVRADVAEAVGESGFLLQGEGLFGGEQILALNATGQPFVVPDDVELQVTGEVRQLVLADVEQEFGIALDPELYADYEQQPVIIAQSTALAPDPAEVTSDPTLFYNQVIAVEGTIGDFVSAGIFQLEEDQLFGGEGLLVLSSVADLNQAALETGEISDDSTVVVTGVLRPYVQAEFEQEYNYWGDEELANLEAEYEREPVLVAREIYASAE